MTVDASQMAAQVRRGEVSPLELVDDAIRRLEAVNPQLNAVIHPLFERARAEAADPRLPAGPLRGVPIVVKDLVLQTAGDPYHAGTRFLRRAGWRADHDSHLTQCFRAAGLVIVGKTNTPELGSLPTTEPLSYGPTRNPWNVDRSPGGSSGGSAAAVAAGAVPVGHGGDGGGSLRVPASACGLVGLKPARGRISAAPDAGEGWGGLATDGVMTRTVRDMAAFLDVMAVPAAGDPYSAPPPARPFRDEVGADPGRLRVGVVAALGGVTVHPECRRAVEVTADLLEKLGHDVVDAHPEALDEVDTFVRHFGRVVAAATAAEVDAWEALLGRPLGEDDLEPGTLYVVEAGRKMSAGRYLASLGWLHGYGRRVARFWADGFDVLVTPTMPDPPPPLGYFAEGAGSRQRVRDHVTFTAPFNATGQPAVSLPLHWTRDGLPIGVQFVGAANGEAILLRVAAQLERAKPWADRRPPVTAA